LKYQDVKPNLAEPEIVEPTSLGVTKNSMHPASRILIYLLAALAIPGLPFFMLPALLLLALAMLIMVRRMPFRLIWRTRWLLLVLLFGYAYSLPGVPVSTLLAEFSPSWEGLRHGMEQAARLTVLLLWLDILVLRLSSEALLAGLLQLMRPFSIIGLDPRRAALRLGLTLRAIEGMERGRGNVRSLLELDYEPDLPQRIQLNLLPLRAIDLAIPGLLFIGLLSQWMITL
jgi:hypothetical protein